MALFQQFIQTTSSSKRMGSQQAGNGSAGLANLVQRDEKTGENYLRLPMPSPEVLNQALQAVGSMLEKFRK